MALMDKIKDAAGQGLSAAKDLGGKGLNKAKDLSEIGAAKAKILMTEAKIKEVYERIGEAVVTAGGVIPEGGIAPYLDKVAEFRAEIAQQEAVIREVNGGDSKAAE